MRDDEGRGGRGWRERNNEPQENVRQTRMDNANLMLTCSIVATTVAASLSLDLLDQTEPRHWWGITRLNSSCFNINI